MKQYSVIIVVLQPLISSQQEEGLRDVPQCGRVEPKAKPSADPLR